MSSSKEKLEALASFTSNLLAKEKRESEEQTEAETENGVTERSEMAAESENDSGPKTEVENKVENTENSDIVRNNVDNHENENEKASSSNNVENVSQIDAGNVVGNGTSINEVDKNGTPKIDTGNETTQNDAENETSKVDAGNEDSQNDAEMKTSQSDAGNETTQNDAGNETSKVGAGNVTSQNDEMQPNQLEETIDLGEGVLEDEEMASQEAEENGEVKSQDDSKSPEGEASLMEVDSKSPEKTSPGSRPGTPESPRDIEIEYKDEDDREWDSRPSSRAESPKPKKVFNVAIGRTFLRLRVKKLNVPKKAFVGTNRVDLKILKHARPSLFRFEKSKIGRSHSSGEKKSRKPSKDSENSKEKEKKKRKESTSSRDKPAKKEKKEPVKTSLKSKPEISDSDSDSDAELKAMRAKILKKSTITNPMENNFISAKLTTSSETTSSSSDIKPKTSSSDISKPVTSSDDTKHSHKPSSDKKSSDKPRERKSSEMSSDKKSKHRRPSKEDVPSKKPTSKPMSRSMPMPIGPVVLKPFVIRIERLTEKQIDDYENGRIKFEPLKEVVKVEAPKEVVKVEPPKIEKRRSRSRSKSKTSRRSSNSSRRSSISSRSSLSSSPVRRSR